MSDTLKEALRDYYSDPHNDAIGFTAFCDLMVGKDPALTFDQLYDKWIELKRDAGLTDG